MSYTITITRTKEVKETKASSYSVLETRYLSAEEFASLDYKQQENCEALPNGQYKRSIYGYPPAVEIVVNKDVKIFEQTVEALDVAAVIIAVNGLES